MPQKGYVKEVGRNTFLLEWVSASVIYILVIICIYIILASALYCIDVETGEIIWTADIGEVWASPIVVKDRIIASSDALYCIDLVNGSVLWKKVFPRGSSLFTDNRVYAYTGSGYACLDITDGTTLWTFEQSGVDFGGATVNEDLFVVGMSNGMVMALDALTGEQKWMYDASDPVTCPPLALGDFIVVGTKRGTVIALGIPEYPKKTECEELLDSSKELLFRRDYPGALKVLGEVGRRLEGESCLEIDILIEYAQDQQKKEKWLDISKVTIGVIIVFCGSYMIWKIGRSTLRNKKDRKEESQ